MHEGDRTGRGWKNRTLHLIGGVQGFLNATQVVGDWASGGKEIFV